MRHAPGTLVKRVLERRGTLGVVAMSERLVEEQGKWSASNKEDVHGEDGHVQHCTYGRD